MTEQYIGQILPAAFGVIPKGWALCNGALLPIAQNQALFSLLGTYYGGNGIQTFALPDLRGRAILGCNFGSVPIGQISGTETVTVQVTQLPAHNHTLQASTTAGTDSRGGVTPTGKIFARNTDGSPTSIFGMVGSAEIALAIATNITNDGGGQAHNNMQPFLVINYMIALTGIFPSRP